MAMTQGPASGDPGSPGSPGDEETSRADPALLGRVVSGKYTIEKFLGGGAMGAVYKARFAALEKNVAVKVMHRAVAVDPNFVGRFHREAKAASRLEHPNSIRVIDFGEEPDGLLYIAMEYVEGRDLYSVIHEDWPISNADIADILMQALAAIAVAHEMGVIHRDLKPENLMILRAKNDEGRDAYLVKVCDFGIAKITEKDDAPTTEGPAAQKLTTQGLVVGTPDYMSPEQARGETLDARSDIYSMGIILYQLLTGRTPFAADTALAIVLKHITEAPPPPSSLYAGVHKGLEAVTLRALAKDRTERFQTARAMRSAIRDAVAGRPAPVEMAAPTLDASELAAAPGGLDQGSSVGKSAAVAAIESAPTIAGGMTASHLTPLGTASATGAEAPPKKSRTGLVVGLVLVGLLAVGGAVAAPRLLGSVRAASGGGEVTPPPSATIASEPATEQIPATAETPATATAIAIAPTADAATDEQAEPTAPDPTLPKHAAHASAGRTHATGKGAAGSTEGTAVATAAEPAPPPAVEPPPPVAAAPPPAAPAPAAPAPPPAPAFNPATCRAQLGATHSSGATNSRDLRLNNTAAAWTACAQRSLRQRPSAPIAAKVRLIFTDNGAFRGATCTGCPPPLAQCIASSTGRTVALRIRGGDVTGEPAFTIATKFTCD